MENNSYSKECIGFHEYGDALCISQPAHDLGSNRFDVLEVSWDDLDWFIDQLCALRYRHQQGGGPWMGIPSVF